MGIDRDPSIGSVVLVGVGIIYGQCYKYYHHNAAVYGQNKHAHANLSLRRILGLEMVARVFWGLTQPRTAQGGRKTAMVGRRSKDAHRTILAPKSD